MKNKENVTALVDRVFAQFFIYLRQALSVCKISTSTSFFANGMKIVLVIGSCISSAFAKAQQQPIPQNIGYEKALKSAQEHATDGNYNEAEAAYKKALALNPSSSGAAYNLGNLHFEKDKRFEAAADYQKAAEVATSKEEKHKIYHNLGNTFYENKQFKEAVEAYKNALRNDPTDEETRYNLALAKKEEEKQGGGGGGGDDENKDDKKEDGDEENGNKEGDKDEKSDGDNKGKENEKEGDDKKDDKGDDKEGDKGDKKEGDKGDGKPKEEEGKAPQRVEGKLTPQQVKQLLEAMSNEEQKIQQKVNAKKTKGKAIKTEKDW